MVVCLKTFLEDSCHLLLVFNDEDFHRDLWPSLMTVSE
jgi:hypothetical protein